MNAWSHNPTLMWGAQGDQCLHARPRVLTLLHHCPQEKAPCMTPSIPLALWQDATLNNFCNCEAWITLILLMCWVTSPCLKDQPWDRP